MYISTVSNARWFAAVLCPLAMLLVANGCANEEERVGSGPQPLTAVCIDTETAPPEGDWICGENRTIECNTHEGAFVDYIYATPSEGETCTTTTVTVNEAGPFLPGSYHIVVTGTVSQEENAEEPVSNDVDVELCASELIVVDTTAPEVTTHDVELWPPNHKVTTLSLADCMTAVDACDSDVQGWFTWASSDEPDNAEGDGNHEPDIVSLDCGSVALRSERQGTGDGRVYTLGWHAEDAAGNAVDGVCHVTVPHDQRGTPAIDSGEDHRIELAPGSCGSSAPPEVEETPSEPLR